MKRKWHEFMEENFPGLLLRPPLFYEWNVGIRYELGVDWKREYDYPDNPYLRGCYKRAFALFEALHSSGDNLIVVLDVSDFGNGRSLHRKLKNFSPYVEKPLLYRINHQTIPYIENDEEESYRTHRFTLECKARELKYKPLVKAICNKDFSLHPRMEHRVYFLNLNKKTIFHVYDDRGCDVLADSPEKIRDLYETFNDWILDYDRAEIDQVFAN